MSMTVNPILPVDCRPGGNARSRAAAGQRDRRAGAEDSRRQSGADRDRQPLDRRALAGSAASRPGLAAGGVADAKDGIRLAVVGQGAASAASADTVTLAPGAIDRCHGRLHRLQRPRERADAARAAGGFGGDASAATGRTVWRRCSPISARSPASSDAAAETAAGDALVLAQQTSLDQNLDRRRSPECLPEIRAVPRGLAGRRERCRRRAPCPI